MTEEEAKALCENNGSNLLNYKPGRSAYLVLPSGEHLRISIGAASVKILTQRFIFGWLWPKVVVSQQISHWESNYRNLDKLKHFGIGSMVLDGLVSLISRIRDFRELVLAWPVMKNPIGVGIENIERMGNNN